MHLIHMSFLYFIALIAFFSAQGADSSSQPEATDNIAALISFPDPNAPKDPLRPTFAEIEIMLDEASERPFFNYESVQRLLRLSKEMQTERYKDSLKTSVQIPVSTTNENLILGVSHLDNKSIQRFFERKEKSLRRISLFLRILNLKKPMINDILNSANDSFYEKWRVLVNGRTVAVSLGGFLAPALSYSQFIRRQLTRIPLFKNLPADSGFYVATTLGVNFGGTWTEEGKFKLRIDPGLDHRVGDQFYTPFGIIGAGFNLTVTYEDRSESDLSYVKARFLKTGLLTTFGNEKVLGFSIPIGINLLPIVGAAAGVSGTISRLSFLDSENFSRIAIYLRQFFASRPKLCRRILRS